jgi:hypothetical protein
MTHPDKADDFTADRHADLDAGEFGGAMTDADYYDRITRCVECGQSTDNRCAQCIRLICLDCAEAGDRGTGGHRCPALDG